MAKQEEHSARIARLEKELAAASTALADAHADTPPELASKRTQAEANGWAIWTIDPTDGYPVQWRAERRVNSGTLDSLSNVSLAGLLAAIDGIDAYRASFKPVDAGEAA